MAIDYTKLTYTIEQLNGPAVTKIRGAVSTGIVGYFEKFGGTNSTLTKNNSPLKIPDADGTKLTDKNIEVFYTFYLLLAQTLQGAETLQGHEEMSGKLNKKDHKHIAQLEGFLQPFVASLTQVTKIISEPETIAPFMKALHTAGLLKVLTTIEMQPKLMQRKGQHYELEPKQLKTIWATVNKQSPELKQAYESLHQKVEVLQQQVLEAKKQKQADDKLAEKMHEFYNLGKVEDLRSVRGESERSESELTEKNLADHRASFSEKNESPASSAGHTDGETRSTNSSQDDNHSSVSKDLEQQDSTMKDKNSASSTPGVNAPTKVSLAVGRYARTPSHEQRDQEAKKVQAKQYELCETLWGKELSNQITIKVNSPDALMEKKRILSQKINENTLFNGNTIPLDNGQTIGIKITTDNIKKQTIITNISLTIQEPEPSLSRTLRAFINFFRGFVFYPPLKQAQPTYTSFSVSEEETQSPKVITRHYESESHPGVSFIQSIGRTLLAPFTTLATPSPKTHFTYKPVPIEEPEPPKVETKARWFPHTYKVTNEKKTSPENELAELGLCQTYHMKRPTVRLDIFKSAGPDSEIATALQKDLELFKAFIALVIKQQALAYNSINTKLSQWESESKKPGSFQAHLKYLQSPDLIQIVTEALEADKTGFNQDNTTQTQALQKTLASMQTGAENLGKNAQETLRNASQRVQEGMKSASSLFSRITNTSSNNPSKKK